MSNTKDTTIVLGSKRYKTAIDTDISLNVPLEGNPKEVEEFDRNNRISLAQVFDDERQASSTFRLSANIDLLFYNVYSGSTGINGSDYHPFTNSLYYVNSINSFNTSMWTGYPQYFEFDLIRGDKDVPGYTTNSGSTPPHMYFTNKSASTYNWNHYVSYAYENDYTKRLEYYRAPGNNNGWVCGDGIPFYIQNPYTEAGQDLISFVCPVEHNLTVGEYVEINIPGWMGYNGQKVFQVYSLGQSGFNSDKYIFNLYNYGFSGWTFSNSTEGTFKRIIDIANSGETKSSYYVRKHKIITNPQDAILTNAGFELNSFDTTRQYEYSSLTPNHVARITEREGNQSYLLTFLRDIDIKPYVDNLNRPISELYITTINKGYFGWFNKPLTNTIPNYPGLRQGFGFNITPSVSEYWSATNRVLNKTNIPTNNYTRTQGANTYTFYYNQDLVSGDTLDGAYCEFNEFDQKERVISEIYHKIVFNENLFKISYILQSSPFFLSTRIPNPEGYYYKPHNKITLRVYSDYIEEGDIKTTEGIPDYAFYSNYFNSAIWRDLYTYGFKDSTGLGVDYPFLNGTHYPSTKIIFRLFPEGNVPENIYDIPDPTTDDCE
jgi:hypothetical protein